MFTSVDFVTAATDDVNEDEDRSNCDARDANAPFIPP